MEISSEVGAHQELALQTHLGSVRVHWYRPAEPPKAAAIFVGGVGGGFDSPSLGLYPRLASELLVDGIASLRVRYRRPTDLEDATLDVLAGIRFLKEQGVERVALVGHSLGGAVVISAAARSELPVAAVVTLATQSYGTSDVGSLGPAGLLLIHGTSDPVLPPACSVQVYERAKGLKRLVLSEGAGHCLDETADEVHAAVSSDLRRALGSA